MKAIKVGSRWRATEGQQFIVLSVVTIEGQTWVHYRNDVKENPREYSCYIESFLSRFTGLPE